MSAVTIGGRQSARMGTDAWLTPRRILGALGEFDLDPCSAPDPRRWPTARNHYTLPRDGLAMPWYGRVWMNPPYGKHARVWLARMAEHGIGTALVFNRSETSWYRTSITRHPNATAVFLLAGRVKFVRPGTYDAPDNGGAPSVLVAYGHRDAEILARCGLDGDFLPLPGRASRSQSPAGSLVTPAGSRTGISDRDAARSPNPR